MATLLNTPRLLVLPTDTSDCDRMAPYLRDADLLEIRSVAGEFTNYAIPLHGCVKQSISAWTIWSKGNHEYPAAIFGVAQDPTNGAVGIPWLLGTSLLQESQRDFLRFSREWLRVLHSCHPVLTNAVHAHNRVHIRWLSWMGFSFIKVHQLRSQTFLEFTHTIHEQIPRGSPQ